jgi:hypothetical protein
MKNRLLMFAGVLAMVAVLGKFYAIPLYAQAKAALVQDRDSPGRNFYQEVESCYLVTSPCVIAFATVPAGERLIIQQVSTLSTMPTATGPADVELRGASGSGVFQFIPVVAAPFNFGGEFQFTAHAPVLASYDVGQVPNVDVFSPTGSSFTVVASISGYTVAIP